MNERQSGFYWINYLGNWQVAEWRKFDMLETKVWVFFGYSPMYDSDDIEVGHQITPDQKFTKDDMIDFAKFSHEDGSWSYVDDFDNWIKKK